MIPYHKIKSDICPCCHGTGTQYSKLTGLNVICPCCGGTGKRRAYLKKQIYGKPSTW